MRYRYIPTQEFITQRNAKIKADKNQKTAPFRWDAEAVEWHQCDIDPKQTMYEGWHYDTNHDDLGHVDYKMYAKAGVHVSEAIQRQIREGNIDTLIVWQWTLPWRDPLKEGMPVDYDILGQIDAKEAFNKIDTKTNRFIF